MGIWTYLHPLEDKVVRLLSSEDLPDATLRSFTAALTSRSHFPREREDGVEDEPELAAKPTEEDTLEDFPLLEKAAVAKGPDTETYLECTKRKSSKYYKVRIDHCTVTCEYGKIGARDAADRSDFASEEEAQTFYAKKIKEKTAKAKGYRKVNLNAKVFKRCKAAWAKLLKNDSKPLNASSERPSKVRKTDADQRSDESKQRESDQQAIGFLDIDKGAEAVAYGICRSANISCCGEDIHLLDCLFPGSKTVGDDVHYGPIRLVRADQIRDLWQTLEPLTAGQISDSLIPQKDPGWPLVLGALCYDKSMASLPQEDLDYLLFHFKQFKRFIEACAQREDIGLLIRFA